MKKWLFWVVGGFAILMIAGIAARGPEPPEKSQARVAIRVCWDGYERKSLDAATKRFVASTCEMMESDFLRRYGHRP